MEGRVVLSKLLLIAQDPQNQTFVAREEGCLAGLVSSLLHVDPEAVLLASRTLQFLSSHPQNKKLMRDFPKIIDNLTTVLSNTENPKAREFSTATLDNLGVRLNENGHFTSKGYKDVSSQTDENCNQNIIRKEYRNVSITLTNVNDEATYAVAHRVLLNLQGVISISFDRKNGIATIGTQEPESTITQRAQEAFSRAGINYACSGVKTDAISKAMSLPSQSEDYEEDDSGYLSESEYQDDKATAVTRWGPSSLEARLEQQRRDEEMKLEQTGRVLSRVGSAFSSASNWLMGW